MTARTPAHRRKRDPYANAVLAPRIAPPPPEHHDAPEPTWTVEQCRSCQQRVIWAVTVNANPMPIDAEPAVQGGNVQLEWRGPDMKPIAHVLPVAKQFGKRNLRTSHFATCPHADRWRTRTRKARA